MLVVASLLQSDRILGGVVVMHMQSCHSLLEDDPSSCLSILRPREHFHVHAMVSPIVFTREVRAVAKVALRCSVIAECCITSHPHLQVCGAQTFLEKLALCVAVLPSTEPL